MCARSSSGGKLSDWLSQEPIKCQEIEEYVFFNEPTSKLTRSQTKESRIFVNNSLGLSEHTDESKYRIYFFLMNQRANLWWSERYVSTELSFVLIRRQFPLKLSFAMSINKSQGQSFNSFGLYLPQHSKIFGHGQLYVALSQCRSKDGLKIYLSKKDRTISNIVYQEVF